MSIFKRSTDARPASATIASTDRAGTSIALTSSRGDAPVDVGLLIAAHPQDAGAGGGVDRAELRNVVQGEGPAEDVEHPGVRLDR
jgi:hypothetical protein